MPSRRTRTTSQSPDFCGDASYSIFVDLACFWVSWLVLRASASARGTAPTGGLPWLRFSARLARYCSCFSLVVQRSDELCARVLASTSSRFWGVSITRKRRFLADFQSNFAPPLRIRRLFIFIAPLPPTTHNRFSSRSWSWVCEALNSELQW